MYLLFATQREDADLDSPLFQSSATDFVFLFCILLTWTQLAQNILSKKKENIFLVT